MCIDKDTGNGGGVCTGNRGTGRTQRGECGEALSRIEVVVLLKYTRTIHIQTTSLYSYIQRLFCSNPPRPLFPRPLRLVRCGSAAGPLVAPAAPQTDEDGQDGSEGKDDGTRDIDDDCPP